jgi:hypothetical protein
MLQWESPHELKAFRLLDATPAVSAFFEQPAVITYTMDGETHDHYPDIEVCGSAREFWEIKTRSEASRAETMRRTETLAIALPAFGYAYRLVIAEDLAASPQLHNATTLLRYGRRSVPLIEREKLRRTLELVSTISWASVLDGGLSPNARAYVSRLVLEGVLTIDWDQKLEAESTVTLSGAVQPPEGTPR